MLGLLQVGLIVWQVEDFEAEALRPAIDAAACSDPAPALDRAEHSQVRNATAWKLNVTLQTITWL
jgi:hypothetical protein